MEAKKIFIIIPAFNEEKNISRVIDSLLPYDYNIVVVDDGSSDKTFDIAKSRPVKVLRHIVNRGQGAALETGDRHALKMGAKIIVHFDADGQFCVKEIGDVVAPIKDGLADVVFGSRFLGKESTMPSAKKYFILPLAKAVNKIFLGVDMSDPQSGFRAMSESFVKELVIENDEMAHCSEILAKACNGHYRVKEAPITVTYHQFGQKFSGGIKILKDLFISKIIR